MSGRVTRGIGILRRFAGRRGIATLVGTSLAASMLLPMPTVIFALGGTSPIQAAQTFVMPVDLPNALDTAENGLLVLLGLNGFSGCSVRYAGKGILVGELLHVEGTIACPSSERSFAANYRVRLGDLDAVDARFTSGPFSSDQGRSTNGIYDEHVVVGFVDRGLFTPFEAFRWMQSTGLQYLGTLQPTNPNASSVATDLSADGNTVVGYSFFASDPLNAPLVLDMSHAFVWTDPAHGGGGIVDLGTANGPTGYSRALGISADGLTIVGESDFAGGRRAFRWNSGAFTNLGTIGGNASIATDISDDGATIVGGAGHAFRWTAVTGLTDLGTLTGHTNSIATAVSNDGRIVLGDSAGRPLSVTGLDQVDFGTDTRAFRWTDPTQGGGGMADLTELVASAGANMTGVVLVSVTGSTVDGQFIMGDMTTPATAPNETVGYILQYCDDFVATCVTGVTSPDSQSGSIGDVGTSLAAASIHLGGTADLLLGFLEPIDGDTSAGPFAGVGSVTLGASGRAETDIPGLSVLGGIALTQQAYGNISVDGALMGALAVRYVLNGKNEVRPYVEAGAWGSPGATLTISRPYANGAGTATGTGSTTGSLGGLYLEAGVIFAPAEAVEVALGASYQHSWLATGAYTESAAGNPFPASFSAALMQSDILKVTASATFTLSESFDLTVSGAVGQAFNSGAINATVAGVGPLQAAPPNVLFAEGGARLSYKATDRISLDAFVMATTGQQIGTHVTIGGGFKVSF